ncbi:hypothetical protein GCM10023214_09120 [Amycolatopsis dongchuanensis]|uniref:Uncharacterized protein n=1 Tax=Amycolatopsis dongchuanensis TaxID=1070866 RepID=A0ABP9Q4B9_9PSEU
MPAERAGRQDLKPDVARSGVERVHLSGLYRPSPIKQIVAVSALLSDLAEYSQWWTK